MYSVASTQLRRGAERQTEVVQDLPYPLLSERLASLLKKQREKQLADDRHELILTLVAINGIIIVAGGVASFLFAKRTLQPIKDAHTAQTRFTANASHELRTPLAVMQTEIEVALRSKNLTTNDARVILSSNLEEVARLRQLSDQLLGLTRTGSESLNLTKVDLSKLVTDQAKLLSKRYGQTIGVETKSSKSISLDKLLIAQVLGILVENAVTYSGQKDAKIKIQTSDRHDSAIIRVINQGKPIPRQDIDRIFDRFYRGPEATKANPKGHGLGLSLAREIITRHNGRLSASSTRTGLTSFSISLPTS